MMGTPPQRFPSIENQNALLYLGSSMNPTFEDLDVIHFSPYQDTPLKKGDVIVIQRHEEPDRKIIHRIISICPDDIRTQGDNCYTMDPWVLRPFEILGYVTSIRRKDQIIRIHRGRFGYQKFLYLRIMAGAFLICKKVMKHPYQLLSPLKLLTRVLSPFLNYRMIKFSGSTRSEIRLFFGPVCIGRLQNGAANWEIKPPYRLFVDPYLLSYSEGNGELISSEIDDN